MPTTLDSRRIKFLQNSTNDFIGEFTIARAGLQQKWNDLKILERFETDVATLTAKHNELIKATFAVNLLFDLTGLVERYDALVKRYELLIEECKDKGQPVAQRLIDRVTLSRYTVNEWKEEIVVLNTADQREISRHNKEENNRGNDPRVATERKVAVPDTLDFLGINAEPDVPKLLDDDSGDLIFLLVLMTSKYALALKFLENFKATLEHAVSFENRLLEKYNKDLDDVLGELLPLFYDEQGIVITINNLTIDPQTLSIKPSDTMPSVRVTEIINSERVRTGLVNGLFNFLVPKTNAKTLSTLEALTLVMKINNHRQDCEAEIKALKEKRSQIEKFLETMGADKDKDIRVKILKDIKEKYLRREAIYALIIEADRYLETDASSYQLTGSVRDRSHTLLSIISMEQFHDLQNELENDLKALTENGSLDLLEKLDGFVVTLMSPEFDEKTTDWKEELFVKKGKQIVATDKLKRFFKKQKEIGYKLDNLKSKLIALTQARNISVLVDDELNEKPISPDERRSLVWSIYVDDDSPQVMSSGESSFLKSPVKTTKLVSNPARHSVSITERAQMQIAGLVNKSHQAQAARASSSKTRKPISVTVAARPSATRATLLPLFFESKSKKSEETPAVVAERSSSTMRARAESTANAAQLAELKKVMAHRHPDADPAEDSAAAISSRSRANSSATPSLKNKFKKTSGSGSGDN